MSVGVCRQNSETHPRELVRAIEKPWLFLGVQIVREGGYHWGWFKKCGNSSSVVYKSNQTGKKSISKFVLCSQTTNDLRLNPSEWRRIESSSSNSCYNQPQHGHNKQLDPLGRPYPEKGSRRQLATIHLHQPSTSASLGKHLHRIRRICSHSVILSSLWKCQASKKKVCDLLRRVPWPSTNFQISGGYSTKTRSCH